MVKLVKAYFRYRSIGLSRFQARAAIKALM
jgi:hypothetical protein